MYIIYIYIYGILYFLSNRRIVFYQIRGIYTIDPGYLEPRIFIQLSLDIYGSTDSYGTPDSYTMNPRYLSHLPRIFYETPDILWNPGYFMEPRIFMKPRIFYGTPDILWNPGYFMEPRIFYGTPDILLNPGYFIEPRILVRMTKVGLLFFWQSLNANPRYSSLLVT